jgi:hypothetical protein
VRGLEQPRRLFAHFADHGFEQRLAELDVPGGLIEDQASIDAFFDDQESAVVLAHGGNRDIGFERHD